MFILVSKNAAFCVVPVPHKTKLELPQRAFNRSAGELFLLESGFDKERSL